jgi:hypothetical protein
VHNATFGVQPPLTIDDFENCEYSGTGVGSVADIRRPILAEQRLGRSSRDCADGGTLAGIYHRHRADYKAKLYAQGLYMKAPPIPGAKDGLLRLKEMGYE